jgi:hypothetical protein
LSNAWSDNVGRSLPGHAFLVYLAGGRGCSCSSSFSTTVSDYLLAGRAGGVVSIATSPATLLLPDRFGSDASARTPTTASGTDRY